jgi:hypothetical protein
MEIESKPSLEGQLVKNFTPRFPKRVMIPAIGKCGACSVIDNCTSTLDYHGEFLLPGYWCFSNNLVAD